MADITQICITIAVLTVLVFIIFVWMINGLDGLHQRVAKLEEERLTDREQAWDEGFTDRGGEEQLQKSNPSHPITRVNPYRSPKNV